MKPTPTLVVAAAVGLLVVAAGCQPEKQDVRPESAAGATIAEPVREPDEPPGRYLATQRPSGIWIMSPGRAY